MLRNLVFSIASLAVVSTVNAQAWSDAPPSCQAAGNKYSYVIDYGSVYVYNSGNNPIATVSMKKNYSYTTLGGQQVLLYYSGNVSAGKLLLFSYSGSRTVYLKHDGVGTFETNCDFYPAN